MTHRLLLSLLLVGVLVALPAVAAPLPATPNPGNAWRLEVELPPNSVPAPTGWWSKLTSWLGARAPLPRPAPGTKFVVRSSAYASSPYQTDSTPCITAAGTRVRQGVVATNFLPLGTILSINDQLYIVEDRMNSRYAGKYLDIWFPSTSEALIFGRKSLEVEIVDYGVPGQELSKAEPVPAKPQGALKRGSLRFMAAARILTSFLKANVANRHDVDCTKVTQ